MYRQETLRQLEAWMLSQACCRLTVGPRLCPFLSLSLRHLYIQEYVLSTPLLGEGREQHERKKVMLKSRIELSH